MDITLSRRGFLSTSALALAAPSLLAQTTAATVSPSQKAASSLELPPPFDSAPVLQNPAAEGMSILCAVKEPCTAWVEYGRDESDRSDPGTGVSLDQRADNSEHGLLPFNGRVHRFRLEGLRPGTTYRYRIVAAPIDFRGPYKIERKQPVPSDTYSFRTLDAGESSVVSFSVINDTHEVPATLSGVTGLLARHTSDLAFWNGDIFNDIRTDEQIVANLMRPAGAPFASSTPLCFVSGNHDVRGVHARSLHRFTDLPNNRRYYTLRKGPVAFIVLDTGEDKADSHQVYGGLNDFARYRTEQQRWLETVISRRDVRDAPFRVLVCHIPLFGDSASEDSRTKWLPHLAQMGIDLAIHGHTHRHKHAAPDAERPWPQLVGGGPNPEAATFIHASADAKQLGIIVRDLSGKEIGNHTVRARG